VVTDHVHDNPRGTLTIPASPVKQRQPGAGPGWPDPSGIVDARITPRERARRQQVRARMRPSDTTVEDKADDRNEDDDGDEAKT
jgi:hypothetical protein